MSEVIVASIFGSVGVIIASLVTGIITKAIKDKEITIKVSEAADRSAKAAALETAKLQITQYNDMQEDLKAARYDNRQLNQRLDQVNSRLDGVYRVLSHWRNYADRLRSQLIQHNIIPVPFEENGQ